MAKVDDAQELGRAFSLHQKGSLKEAATIYRRLIKNNPKNYHALHFLGIIEADSRNFADAKPLMACSLSIQPPNIEFINNYATMLFNSGDHKDAIEICNRGLRIDGKNTHLIYINALCLFRIGNLSESLRQFDRLVSYQPNHVVAFNDRGSVLAEMRQYDAALASFDRAHALEPRYAEAYLNKGNVYFELERYDDALAAFDKALSIKPDLADAWHGRGNVFVNLKRYDEALSAYDKALALKPDFAKAWHGRGNTLNHLRRHDQAARAYAKVLEIDRNFKFAKGLFVNEKMLSCDWKGVDPLIGEIEKDIIAGKLAAEPFGWQGIARSDRSLQKCAELYCKTRFPADPENPARRPLDAHQKLRIGYSSGEFRQQATSLLLVGVLEQHDDARFEIYAVDNGWDDLSETRRRIDSAVHRIININGLNRAEAAAAIRENQIDILVNLNGYFGEARMEVFAQRPAPIQVNYLGFPGTLGAGYIDYIIADKHVIPDDHKMFFTEKVVYLPNCYQANDRRKEIGTGAAGRADMGLPEDGFVFCCFNNNFKIAPDIFNVWMRVLKKIEGSVLWLLEDNAAAAVNLRQEAVARGVSAERIVFAKRVPLPEHLARHRCADLFLDTLPYNAHTTASDALWAGLPVLTCVGDTFAGRVAASLLYAIDVPELISPSLEAYEQLAIGLATDPDRLAAIKQKLSDNRLTTPLFDTARFTRDLEAAYTAMAARHRAGLPPDHIDVADAG